jgi:nucleoporin p58/p45
MEEVERQLSSIEHRDEHSPQAIANAIQAQNSSFMSLAAQVASLHSEIESLRKDYTKWYQQSYQSARDPFSMETMAAVI